ncbi:MAG: DNA repair protein RadA [bacterium]|nr:DNA repair protein RadA [bacterium]
MGIKKSYICSNCGAQSSSWSGKCFSCGEWNTLEETITETGTTSKVRGSSKTALTIVDSKAAANNDQPRLTTGIKDLDMVFGGGLVPGSVVLIAGEPGIGKSTLLLQISSNISKNHRVLYVSGEESTHQVGIRAKRLGVSDAKLSIAASNNAEEIASEVNSKHFEVVVVDSIQTVGSEKLTSNPGSISQINTATNLLINSAKSSNTVVIIVGHVTKDGTIAGPKLLEHLVDSVFQIEGDKFGGFKILRSVKNRFGSTNDVALFEMNEKGMEIITNPSKALLSERQITDGSIVFAAMEGSRPVLVEVQALVNPTNYGYPKRAASGFDLNRLNLLVAMLEKRTKLQLSDKDIYINIVGGIKIREPAIDLAICMAIATASKGMILKQNLVVFGETGLSGEVRQVPFIEKRVKEALKMGFEGALGPKIRHGTKPANYEQVDHVRTCLNSFLQN